MKLRKLHAHKASLGVEQEEREGKLTLYKFGLALCYCSLIVYVIYSIYVMYIINVMYSIYVEQHE